MAGVVKVTSSVAALLCADIAGHEQIKTGSRVNIPQFDPFPNRVSFFSPELRPGSADLTWAPVLAALSQFTVIF